MPFISSTCRGSLPDLKPASDIDMQVSNTCGFLPIEEALLKVLTERGLAKAEGILVILSLNPLKGACSVLTDRMLCHIGLGSPRASSAGTEQSYAGAFTQCLHQRKQDILYAPQGLGNDRVLRTEEV